MTAATHQLGQLRHLELLARVMETARPSDEMALRLGSQSKEQLIDLLTRNGSGT